MLKTISALGAATLMLSSVSAYAGEAQISRSSEPAEQAAGLQANSTLFFVAAIVAVALGIFLLIDDDDEEGLSP